jgi:hypothetical protein
MRERLKRAEKTPGNPPRRRRGTMSYFSKEVHSMANLTTKELTALDEQIGTEQVLVKKFESMATMCTDAKLQQDLCGFAEKHRAHYNTLTAFLQ